MIMRIFEVETQPYMAFNPQKHHRRSIRLKEYDYSSEGLYFITICVQNKLELFGKIKNEEMILNEFGKIAHDEWAATPNIRENITLGEFQIMPNHLHGIIQINYSKGNPEDIGKFKSPTQTIGAIIRGFKGAATKRIKALLRENRLNNINSTGESQFGQKDQSQGKSQFATTQFAKKKHHTGESQFAPTDIAPTQFAPIEKIAPTKSIWQRDYYEIIIRDSRAYNNISNYIINNPKKWTEDKFYKSNKRK